MAHKFGASSITVLNKGHAACSANPGIFVSTDNTYKYTVYMQYPGRNVYKLLRKEANWTEKDMAAAIQACSENSIDDSLQSCKELSSSKRLNVMYKVMCGSESEPSMRR